MDICPVSGRNRSTGALVHPVKEAPISELWRLLRPQLDLLRAIGGLTVSGGEALLQSESLAALFQLCRKEDIHTAVETSGALPKKHIKKVARLTDCWLYGLRPTPFYVPPHAGNTDENLTFLVKTGSRIIIRTPVIAGITDLPVSLMRIAETMRTNGLHEIQLLPFNRETSHFYHALGRKCRVGDEAIASSERLEAVQSFFSRKGFSVSVVQ
jgi:pyruvate formate lyase activating enzyme